MSLKHFTTTMRPAPRRDKQLACPRTSNDRTSWQLVPTVDPLRRCPLVRTLAFAAVLLLLAGLSQEAGAQTFLDLFPSTTREKGTRVKKVEKSAEEALIQEETEEEKLIDAFVMRHVKFNSDWNPDPTAMPQFTYHFRKALRMRCRMMDEPLELSDPEIFKWPLLYMSAHNSFKLSKAEREGLKRYLEQGGVMVGDDCAVGGGGWLPSLYSEINRIFPGKSFIDVKPDDPRFAKMFKISYHFSRAPMVIVRRPNRALMLNDRIAIYVILDDYGCIWEVSSPPTAANPLGISNHGFDYEQRKGCLEFCFNLMLYLMTH